MASALIGATGFVGGNLRAQNRFDDFYNSANIEEIAGRSYDLVVCAGAPAEKWRANKEPEADTRALERLAKPLCQADIKKLLLISTVDVYPEPIAVDETTFIDPCAGQPYGRHRFELENRLRTRFDTLVVRLPGLFGSGLKKNAIYDFLNDNNVQAIHADAVFQFYGLGRLWRDLEGFLRSGLELVNVATEPVSVREVAARAFEISFENRPSGTPARYDVRTTYAERFGGSGHYLADKERVLAELSDYVRAQKAGGR